MFSLERDASQWFRDLPVASISSLKDFNLCFHSHCKRICPAEVLLEDCCKVQSKGQKFADEECAEYAPQDYHY